MNTIPKLLQDKFFSDPDWVHVQNLLQDRVDEFKNFDTIDTTQSAEAVKAEIIGRRIAYNALTEFLEQSNLLTRKETKTTTFR